MINYKCFGKVGPCLFVAESIGKDGETYYLNVNVKRRAYSRIKRTRKRQIAKAKHMMACHDQRVMSGHNGGTAKLESLRGGNNETKASKENW